MTDHERKGPFALIPQRYSSTIPPERRGRTSGKFRFDLQKKLTDNPVHEGFLRLEYSQEDLMKWNTTAVLLKSFKTWDLLPPDIRDRACEEQRILLRFISDGVPDPDRPGKKKIPPAEAIMVELARVLLGTIDEWNELEPSLQMMLEHEMIEFIGEHHPEMDIPYEEQQPDPKKNFIRELESNHHVDHRPANYAELLEEARQKVILKIKKKIIATVQELEFEENGTNRGRWSDHEDLQETTYVDIEEVNEAIRKAAAAITPPAAPDAKPRDTIPAIPSAMAKRKGILPKK